MKMREKFGSRLGFILVSAGCAIGLGNVYKFPYITGQYGGAAFILIYLVFLAILGLPVMACEFAVGRAAQCGMVGAFEKLEPKKSKWHRLKWISILGCYLLLMSYTTITGWMMYYAWKTATGGLAGLDSAGVTQAFSDMTSSGGTMALWMVLAVLISFAVCSIGLQKGIERITKIMMTCLMLLIIILAINSLMLDGAEKGVKFYLIPDFKLAMSYGLGNVI